MTIETTSTTEQALPNDFQPLPGTPFGILLVGALGWLSAISGLILLPWTLPGAPPTPIGSHLMRFVVSIPGESIPAALVRHGIDLLPYAIIIFVPLSLVVAMGWRRARAGVRALTILGLLGIAYSAGSALQFGGLLFVGGCILIAVSGWLGWSLPITRYDESMYNPSIDQRSQTSYEPGTPMAVPFDEAPRVSSASAIDQPIR